jgi:outer membrane protein assembly factor BamB
MCIRQVQHCGLCLGVALTICVSKSAIAASLLVSSFGSDEVLAFDATTGAFLNTVIKESNGSLSGPRGMTVGSNGNLYVANRNSGSVVRSNSATGSLVDVFVPTGSGGLGTAGDVVVAPDGSLLVSSANTDQILRYDGTTGVFLNEFVIKGTTEGPLFMTTGADGNLYVGSFVDDRVDRYDLSTGEYIGPFASGGGLTQPWGIAFGPDHNLYVSSEGTHEILRYDGSTGAFLNVFVPSESGGLNAPRGLTFGPDGNLYVTSESKPDSPPRILRYDGATGAFMDEFVSSFPAMRTPLDLVFIEESVPTPPTLRWEYKATVAEIADPAGLFPDLQLGDTVRGSISYDLGSAPLFFFHHAGWFQVATMIIENPRTGEELRFVSDSGEPPFVGVLNDVEFDPELGINDQVAAFQFVLPPQGFTGDDPVIAVQFDGPPDILTDDSLPTELVLDEWPIVAVSFLDFYQADLNGTAIHALINELTPVPNLAGDFDSSGEVDLADYDAWRASFGTRHTFLDTDANSNGVVDAADYVIWRRALTQSFSNVPARASVPEPCTLVFVALALLAIGQKSWLSATQRVPGRGPRFGRGLSAKC